MSTNQQMAVAYEAEGAPIHPGGEVTPPSSDDKKSLNEKSHGFGEIRSAEDEFDDGDGRLPTDEERDTLRLVAGKIPWQGYLICLVEFAERASYYGCVNIFNNFVQRPLPPGGNGGGATAKGSQDTPGALGLGLAAASGITKAFQFLAYAIPILGGIIADTRWGKFETICVGTGIGLIAHIILVISAVPSVIATGHAVAPFAISVVILAFATGFCCCWTCC